MEQLLKMTLPKAADLIAKQRTGSLRIIPGFDGVYGRLVDDTAERTEEPGLHSAYGAG